MSAEHGKFKPDQQDEPKDPSKRFFLKQIGVLGGLAILETSKLNKAIGAAEKYAEQQELKELLFEIEKYSNGLKVVLENIYNPEKSQELPATVWEKVDKIFSGPLESLQKGNRELADEGKNAHVVAYLMQDFRNSETAEKLSTMYKNLLPTKRIELENSIKEKINDHATYELLFKIDLRPPVFNFKDDPKNTIDALKKFYKWERNNGNDPRKN